jgi:nitrous oxidase accessory protein NosD
MTSAIIEGNTFSSAPDEAVEVTTGAETTIVDNRFYGNGQAVTVSHAGATIRDNGFVSNTTAINLMGTDAKVAGNSISDGDMGISIVTSGAPDIRDNMVEGLASRGIFVGGGTRPTIEGNTACGSGVDVYVEPSAHPVMGDNDICIEGPTVGA